MEGFMRIANFKRCSAAFCRWMDEQYDVNVKTVTSIDLDKEMYQSMAAVKATCDGADLPLSELNNRALNALQKTYVEKLKLVKRSTKPSFKPLDRDAQLYRDRPITTGGNNPNGVFTRKGNEAAADDGMDVARAFDMMLSSRKGGPEMPVAPTQAFAPTKEEVMSHTDFQARLKMLETMRMDALVVEPTAKVTQVNDRLQTSIQVQASVEEQHDKADPADLYRTAASVLDTACHDASSALMAAAPPPLYPNSALDVLLPNSARQQSAPVHTFFSINGFDRDCAAYPQRYRFSVDMNKLGNTYRNVAAVAFTTLVLPMEIGDSRSLVNSVSKPIYYNDQRLAYPYVLLQVDELPSACDGLNQQTRKSVAQFIYDTSYKCPNGRGYIVMKPAHGSRDAVAAARAVANLNKLSITLAKPNGALINTSSDAYRILKVEYQTYNATYLQIVLDRFFDKNEFCLGDGMQLSGVSIFPPATLSASAPNPPPSVADFNALTEFINRPEGHDILQLGDSNSNGFYNAFYIAAPLVLDTLTGKLVVNKAQVDALREYNIAFPVSPSNPRPIGRAMNTSLQVTLSGTIITQG